MASNRNRGNSYVDTCFVKHHFLDLLVLWHIEGRYGPGYEIKAEFYLDSIEPGKDTEVRGIDIAKHGEPAYPNAAYGHGWDTEGKKEAIEKGW